MTTGVKYKFEREMYALPDGLIVLLTPWRHVEEYADVAWFPLRVIPYVRSPDFAEVILKWIEDEIPILQHQNPSTCSLEPRKFAWKLAKATSQKAFAQKAHCLILSQGPGKPYIGSHGAPSLVNPWEKSLDHVLGDWDSEKRTIAQGVLRILDGIFDVEGTKPQ